MQRSMNNLLEEIKKIEMILCESFGDVPIHLLRDGKGFDVRKWNKWYDGRGLDLEGINLRGSDLGEFNLEGVNFKRANLESVNFSWANLKNANLQNAKLWYADLKCANLQGVNFKGTDLRWANFHSKITPLNKAKFKNIKHDGRTKWPDDFDYSNWID